MAVPAAVKDEIDSCRQEVNEELIYIHKRLDENVWTPERAEAIAQRAAELASGKAADLAVDKITNNLYMGVGKKTLVIIGATIVVTWDQFRIGLKEGLKKVIGL